MTSTDLAPSLIEVFKTDIDSARRGKVVLQALHQRFPALSATLDLEDCDRVLCVRSPAADSLYWTQVQAFVQGLGVSIELLPD